MSSLLKINPSDRSSVFTAYLSHLHTSTCLRYKDFTMGGSGNKLWLCGKRDRWWWWSNLVSFCRDHCDWELYLPPSNNLAGNLWQDWAKFSRPRGEPIFAEMASFWPTWCNLTSQQPCCSNIPTPMNSFDLLLPFFQKTSQELRMLSSVTINCQVTKIFINPGSQFSVL